MDPAEQGRARPGEEEEDASARREVPAAEAVGVPEASDDEDDAAPKAPLLCGDWQQLEGVPRPMGAEGGPHFMAWSDRGHVASFPSEQRTEVQHAGKEDRPRRVAVLREASMASISEDVCCLASGAGAEGGSQLVIRPLERWDKAAFTAFLGGDDESVEAVACGTGFVAALTSRSVLRVYSASGLPTGVLCVHGTPVALAARGALLMVVTSSGCGGSELMREDLLHYRLLDVRSRSQRSAGHLPLSAGARLRWLGISRELVPTSVDSAGVVRALFSSGAGSWGAAGGGGAEWMPVGSLAEEEERVGPLWVVYAARGTLFCSEAGKACEEPLPQPRAAEPGAEEGAASLDGAPPHFGSGAALKEMPWRLQLGANSAACASIVEDTLRHELLGRHVDEMMSAGLLPQDWQAGPEAVGKAWKSKPMFLFGNLVQKGEVERALDVATGFLHSGPLLLAKARQFAEAAGEHKLADRIAEIPVVQTSLSQSVPPPTGAAAAPPVQPAQAAAQPQASRAAPVPSVPKVVRQELPPLFGPKDDMEDAQERLTQPTSAPPSVPATGASQPLASAQQPLGASPEAETRVRAVPHNPVAVAPAAAAEPAAAAPAGGAAAGARQTHNPFKRKHAAPRLAAQAPHLLRDSLGSGVVLGRPAATPMRASEELASTGEPAAKTSKV